MILAGFAVPAARAGGALYGNVTTTHGNVYTGELRWDRNENFWDDFLDTSKARRVRAGTRTRRKKLFGLDLGEKEEPRFVHPQLVIAFGHLVSVERHFKRDAVLTLKSGQVLRLRKPSGDLGRGVRNVVVEDAQAGTVTLEWDEVQKVEFAQEPGEGRDAQRLYGTVQSTAGEFTGYVVWDRDESLRQDVLDGEDAAGRDVEIDFSRIVTLRKVDDASTDVLQTDGAHVVLSGTNDVNEENRGIDVMVAGLGRVELDWDVFLEVRFAPAPPSPTYDSFDGGHPLYGEVLDTDGRRLRGEVVWNLDEAYTYETLDGFAEDVGYAIPFENIAVLRRDAAAWVEVQLRDGRMLRLSDTNEVGSGTRGLRVTSDDGGVEEIAWADFVELVLEP